MFKNCVAEEICIKEANNIPAPYRRGYHHTKSKGHEHAIACNFCGKQVPKWKTFPVMKFFRINDPVLRQQIDPRFIGSFGRKMYACPSCARHRGIVQIGKSRKSRVGWQR